MGYRDRREVEELIEKLGDTGKVPEEFSDDVDRLIEDGDVYEAETKPDV